MMRTDLGLGRWDSVDPPLGKLTALMSHARLVRLVARDSKGGQFSIFADGLDGAFTIRDRHGSDRRREGVPEDAIPRLEAAAMEALAQFSPASGRRDPAALRDVRNGFYGATRGDGSCRPRIRLRAANLERSRLAFPGGCTT